MSTITKVQIVKNIADATGQSMTGVTEAVDKFLEQITLQTNEGLSVSIHGFGKFERRTRAARPGRNPKTGETIQIAESTNLAFKPAKALKA